MMEEMTLDIRGNNKTKGYKAGCEIKALTAMYTTHLNIYIKGCIFAEIKQMKQIEEEQKRRRKSISKLF